jgi:hypothetical protein
MRSQSTLQRQDFREHPIQGVCDLFCLIKPKFVIFNRLFNQKNSILFIFEANCTKWCGSVYLQLKRKFLRTTLNVHKLHLYLLRECSSHITGDKQGGRRDHICQVYVKKPQLTNCVFHLRSSHPLLYLF